VIARLTLGYVLGVLSIVAYLASTGGQARSYTLAIQMTADVSGRLQVYYDIGKGLRELDSVAVALDPDRREYDLPLPVGTYRLLRIDPGMVGGRYRIERADIRRPDGSTYRSIPLAELHPVHQLSLIERTRERLVVESPPGSNDPQLLYTPAGPFSLAAEHVGRLAARLLAYWIAAVLLVALLELALRRAAAAVSRAGQSAVRWADAHPHGAVLVAATVATVTATFPVLFLNRSVVSPNNHGLYMLYEQLPFVPGGGDPVLEDVRGSDVGAAMWASVPYADVQRQALSQGEMPLWNRFNNAGLPLWAQGLAPFGDPLQWLTFLDSDWGMDLKAIAHRFTFAAGVGFAALAAGSAWLPAAVATMAAPFFGFFTFRFIHPASFSITYGPWILMAWFALAAAHTRAHMARATLLLAAASALELLASPPKEAFLVMAGCQAAGLLALLLSGRGPHSGRHPETRQRLLWKRLAFAAVAGAATVTLTAPHWLVFLDTLSRSVTVYDQPGVGFYRWADLPRIWLGSLTSGSALPSLHITAMMLLLAAVVIRSSLVRRPAIVACLVAAVCLMAVGFGAVPRDWLVRVPLLRNVHHVNDVTVTAAIVPLAVVCAAGAESLLTPSPSRIAILTVLLGLASALLLRDAAGRADEWTEPWLIGLLLAGMMAVPCCVRVVRSQRGRVLPVVSTASLGALLLLPGGWLVETGLPSLDRLLAQPRLRADLDAMSPAVEAVHRGMAEPARTVGLGGVLIGGSQAIYDLEGIGGPDPLFMNYYQELINAAGIQRFENPRWLTVVTAADVERMAPLMDILNVGFVLSPSGFTPPGLVEVPMDGPDLLKPWRRPTAWPRAFFADGVGTYVDAQDLARALADRRKPFAAVQSNDRQATEATRTMQAPAGEVVPARNYELTANTTAFVVRSPGPGVAVLAETFVPDDFRATVNGERVPYFRVNHAFKAVVIPSAGEWAVKFEYRPRLWNLSLVVASVGILLMGGLALAGRTRVMNVR
jgi:hypothetical protein